MTILPVIVVTLSTLTLLFWILKHCLKWNIFGVADDKSTAKSTLLQKTNVAPSEPEHTSQIEPSEANQENEEETPKEFPEKNKSFPGEDNEASSLSEETINLSHNVKGTHDLLTAEQSYPDIIDEESLSSDHELEFSPSKQSPITIKKTPAVKKCSVMVKKWKVPIKGCGVLLKNCLTVPADIPVEDLDSEKLLEFKTSSVSELESDSNNDNIDANDKPNARWRKPVAVATKDSVAPIPKTTVKRTTKKPTIELPSPISVNNNNSATKKKKKLFSLTPQQSEIFNPVEVEFCEVDPHNIVMKQLRDRRPKRK